MNDDFVPAEEFDAWAEGYDAQVSADSGFPFDGYSQVLKTVARLAQAGPGDALLDVGIGTGNLAALLAGQGAAIWGIDFSARMLARARAKLPGATLAQANARDELPPDFQRRYQAIVSGYTFHHFPLEEKVAILERLRARRLAPGGRIVIGDLAFADASEQEALRRKLGPEWEQEYYWLADEALAALRAADMAAEFTRVSSCAGVFLIR